MLIFTLVSTLRQHLRSSFGATHALSKNAGFLLKFPASASSELHSTPHSALRNFRNLRHFCANKQKEAEADGTRCLKSNNKSNEIRPLPKISHSTLLYIPCKALTGVGFAARHRKCVHSFSTSDFLRPPPLHHLANSFCHLPLPGQVLRTPLYIILPPPRPSTPGNWQERGLAGRGSRGRSPARPGTETPSREELVRGQPAEEKTLKHSLSGITGGQNSRSPHRVGSAGSAAAERLLGGATDRAPIKVRKQERGKGKERKGKERKGKERKGKG